MNKMRLICNSLTILALILCTTAAAFAQKPAPTEDWVIADKQVDCRGSAPQKCLVVRETNSADWKYFYNRISGFQFRDGDTQKIRVSILPRQNVPADASSLNYKLIKVLSRSKTDGNTFEEAKRQLKNQKPLLLEGKKWILTEIEKSKAETTAAFIQFDGRNKKFSAKVCNSIGGTFTQNGSSLKFSNAFSTKMACAEPLSSTETKFQDSLEKVTRAEQNGDDLTLFGGNVAVLKFAAEKAKEPGSDKALEDTKWVLTSIENNKIAPRGNIPFLQFDREKMMFAGNSGCNRIFGKFEVSRETLRFGEVAMTRMACRAQENQAVETDLTAALKKVNRYEINNGVLILFADDKSLLKFLPLGR